MAEPLPIAKPTVVQAHVVRFKADPFETSPEQAVQHFPAGAVAIDNGRISDFGEATDVLARAPKGAEIIDYRGHLIHAGFIDCHVHYPQLRVIASYGERLIDWLNKYIFPVEARFSDKAYATATAEIFIHEMLRNGVTSASVYCAFSSESVDAFFEAAAKHNLLVLAGQVLMNRHAPELLLSLPDSTYANVERSISKWHGTGRALYTLTPRFAPTSTESELQAIARLWNEHPDLRLQTHLSETREEVEWVQKLFPGATDYLDVYDRVGLVRPGAVFGHSIHLSERELARLHESGAAIAHCPTSNLFLGSGLFSLASVKHPGRSVTTGLGTDIGAGTSFSMLQTMGAAYEVAQLRQHSLHPFQALYLATVGSAKTLRINDRVGNIDIGKDADLVVINPRSTELLDTRLQNAENLVDIIFSQMILGDDRAIAATMVDGKFVFRRP